MPLSDLFPDEDYRFHLTLRRGDAVEFFRAADPTGNTLAERRRWLADPGPRYVDVQPGHEAIVDDFAACATAWLHAPPSTGTAPSVSPTQTAAPAIAPPASPPHVAAHSFPPSRSANTLEKLRALGAAFEPDVLLLSPEPHGDFHLRAGALCFPTSWSLEEKIGQPMSFIHGPVPGLNNALAPRIDTFLARLKPGAVFLRENWGLAATAELNLHPALGRPRLALPFDPERIWLRVERQLLLGLGAAGGILFAIRVENHRLASLRADAVTAAGLRRALVTMADPVAAYKGLAPIRPEIIRWLTPA